MPRRAACAGQTYTLGVLLPDLRNPFFADIVAGINEALVRTQYQTLLGVGQSAATTEHALVDAMIDRQMDGVILIGPRIPTEELDADRRAHPDRDHRAASAGRRRISTPSTTTTSSAARWSSAICTRPATATSPICRWIFLLPLSAMTFAQREKGYRAAMKELGLSRQIRVVLAPQHARDIQVAARHLLESRQRPEAIFCWTDFVALEVLSVARELGLSVPDDLAMVGYDNTSYCDLAQNALTSIDQSGQVLGLQAARLLIERIKGRTAAEHFVITPRLVARASSRRRT